MKRGLNMAALMSMSLFLFLVKVSSQRCFCLQHLLFHNYGTSIYNIVCLKAQSVIIQLLPFGITSLPTDESALFAIEYSKVKIQVNINSTFYSVLSENQLLFTQQQSLLNPNAAVLVHDHQPLPLCELQ